MINFFGKTALHDLSPQLKWDYCKAQIKDCSITFAKQNASKRRNDIADLRSSLKVLQSKVSNSTMNTKLPDSELLKKSARCPNGTGPIRPTRGQWGSNKVKNQMD